MVFWNYFRRSVVPWRVFRSMIAQTADGLNGVRRPSTSMVKKCGTFPVLTPAWRAPLASSTVNARGKRKPFRPGLSAHRTRSLSRRRPVKSLATKTATDGKPDARRGSNRVNSALLKRNRRLSETRSPCVTGSGGVDDFRAPSPRQLPIPPGSIRHRPPPGRRLPHTPPPKTSDLPDPTPPPAYGHTTRGIKERVRTGAKKSCRADATLTACARTIRTTH